MTKRGRSIEEDVLFQHARAAMDIWRRLENTAALHRLIPSREEQFFGVVIGAFGWGFGGTEGKR